MSASEYLKKKVLLPKDPARKPNEPKGSTHSRQLPGKPTMRTFLQFKEVLESTRATIRRHKAGALSPEQREKFIKRQEGKIAKIDKEGKLSARASQIRDTIRAVSEGAAWTRSEGKNPEGGLNKKGVESYRRENPGSKLQTAVTTDPKKLKKGSKKAKRRLSFCRRMKGMKKKLTSAKTARDPNSRINKSLRKWNC